VSELSFYLGTHEPSWLRSADVPLFVSHRRLARLKTLHPATCRWALDSGGFTELSLHGKWVTSAEGYAAAAADYMTTVGNLDFAAIQDWMCEPFMLQQTGLTVRQHQERTVASYLQLRDLAPGVPWLPVLQGWTLADYMTCADLYAAAGVDLTLLPRVGLGSVCRRQNTIRIGMLVSVLSGLGLKLHGFGVKTSGLSLYGAHLASADSMAWSLDARHAAPLPGCTHKNCANCLIYAAIWRDQLLGRHVLSGYAA